MYYGRTLKEAWEKFERNLKTKELIYEYKCPHCGHVNVREGARAQVVCDRCGKTFYTFTTNITWTSKGSKPTEKENSKHPIEKLMERTYNYTCPVCGHVNKRKGLKGMVVCDKCRVIFEPKWKGLFNPL